jgi:predicted RNase H-like nuclease (RuvC/YqgF family)
MEGMTENGFTVSAVDLRTGSVRVEKDKGQMVREGQMDRDMVQHAYQSRLMNAMRAKGRMDSYAAAFHRVNNEIGERKTQLQQVEEMEARNAVRMRFKERVTEREQQVQQLRQELEQMRAENEALQADLIDELKTIEKMKDTLAEYQEMERLDRDGRLHKDKQNRFRSLKLAVYPTRNYPGISESLIEQAEAAYQEELEGYNARAQAYNEKAATYQQLRRKVITNQES